MNYKDPATLEKWAFYWSEARLILAAFALLLGGVPAVFLLLPGLYGLTWPLLRLAWFISGVVSIYLAYQWYQRKEVFGGNDIWGKVAFAILIVTGLNLGFTSLFGANIGMSILGGRTVFFVAGLIYLAVAIYAFKRWSARGQKIF